MRALPLICPFGAAVSPFSLWLAGQLFFFFFFSRLTWQIHFWLHWSVVGPSSLVQSFYLTLCWRIKTACGWWHRNVPFAWSGQSSIDFSVRHGFGLSGCISRARQPAPVSVCRSTSHVDARVIGPCACERQGWLQGLKNGKQMQSLATALTEEFDFVTVTCSYYIKSGFQ